MRAREGPSRRVGALQPERRVVAVDVSCESGRSAPCSWAGLFTQVSAPLLALLRLRDGPAPTACRTLSRNQMLRSFVICSEKKSQ